MPRGAGHDGKRRHGGGDRRRRHHGRGRHHGHRRHRRRGPRPAAPFSSFDDGWLFFKGDATGAEQTGFADSAWRALNVPHDWSIEGPFDQNAPTLGNGGYLPAGIGWYRKHFTLPAALQGKRIFVEFDGVMANASIYINGTLLGTRANGYISFRYEITAQASFGGSGNVIAVRANNSAQPASRWYAGAGIYRHVRIIATDPVHVAQWATFVTTPTATTSAATVHVADHRHQPGDDGAERDRAGGGDRPERHRAGARHVRRRRTSPPARRWTSPSTSPSRTRSSGARPRPACIR